MQAVGHTEPRAFNFTWLLLAALPRVVHAPCLSFPEAVTGLPVLETALRGLADIDSG
jgi:hypothetical protein